MTPCCGRDQKRRCFLLAVTAQRRAGRVGEFEFSEDVKRRFESLWTEHLLPVTGYQTYGDLIADLKR